MPPMLSNVLSDFLTVNSFLNLFDICRDANGTQGAFRSDPPSNEFASSFRFFAIAIGDIVVVGVVTDRALFDSFATDPSKISFGSLDE